MNMQVTTIYISRVSPGTYLSAYLKEGMDSLVGYTPTVRAGDRTRTSGCIARHAKHLTKETLPYTSHIGKQTRTLNKNTDVHTLFYRSVYLRDFPWNRTKSHCELILLKKVNPTSFLTFNGKDNDSTQYSLKLL